MKLPMIDSPRMKKFRPVCRTVAAALLLTIIAAGLYGCSGAQAAPESTFVLLDGSKKTTADLKGKVTLVNFWATLFPLVFFAAAIFTYLVHGLLNDTDNQMARPHKLGPTTLPGFLIQGFSGR